MPNLLGRAMRYYFDALNYAKGEKSARPLVGRLLFQTSRVGKQVSTENVDYYLRLAVANPTILSCVSRISDRIADPDLFIPQYRDGNTWTDDLTHPFLDLLRKPNSFMDASLLFGDTTWWHRMLGNAYWFLVTDSPGVGQPSEILPLPAKNVVPDPMSLRWSSITGNLVIDYDYYPNGTSPQRLPGENIVHFRTPNPFDYWQGLSPLSALQDNLATSNNQKRWAGSYYGENNAIPAAIISAPPSLLDDELEELRDSIKTEFGGQRRAAVVRSGELAVQVIQHTVNDMQMLEHLRFSAEEVREVYRVPPNLDTAASGQARLAAETALARDVVQPIINQFASTMTKQIAPFYQEDGLRFVSADVVPQDRAMLIAEYRAYKAERTINEARKSQDLPVLKLPAELAQFQVLLDSVPQALLGVMLSTMLPNQQTGSQWHLADTQIGMGYGPSIRALPDQLDPVQGLLTEKGWSAEEIEALLLALEASHAT